MKENRWCKDIILDTRLLFGSKAVGAELRKGPLASFLGMALVADLSGKQTITNQGLGLIFSPCEGPR